MSEAGDAAKGPASLPVKAVLHQRLPVVPRFAFGSVIAVLHPLLLSFLGFAGLFVGFGGKGWGADKGEAQGGDQGSHSFLHDGEMPHSIAPAPGVTDLCPTLDCAPRHARRIIILPPNGAALSGERSLAVPTREVK